MRSATIKRCSWVSVDNPLMLQYHDRELGVPVHKAPDAAVAGSAQITGKPEVSKRKKGPRAPEMGFLRQRARAGAWELYLELRKNYGKRNWIVTVRCIATGLPSSDAG